MNGLTLRHLCYMCCVLCVAILSSCDVADTDVEVELQDQEWAIPLVNSRLTVSTITDNTEGTSISVDADGSLTVRYEGDVVERSVDEIFVVVDTLYELPVLIDGIRVPVPETEDGDKVDRMIFGPTSSMWIERTNLSTETETVTVSLPDFTKDGNVVSLSVEIPPGETVTSDVFSLEDVLVIPAGDSLGVDLTVNGQPGAFNFTTFLYIENLDLNYLEGLIQERIFDDFDGDIITVGIFDNWISGGIDFTDPKLRIDVINGFGMPVSSIFNEISITTTEGTVLDIESSLIDEGVSVNYPSLAEAGQTKTTTFAFDKDNSNIRQVFNQRAAKVSYDIAARVNPDTEEEQGFLDRNSFFRIDVAVELPLEGRVNDFVVRGDSELDLEVLDDAKSAVFKTIFENGFPLDVFTQLYFLDDDGSIVDSLFESGTVLIEGASIDSNRRVSADQTTILETPLDAEKLARIRNASSIDVTARLDTPDAIDGQVDIFSDYGLGIKMGARVIID